MIHKCTIFYLLQSVDEWFHVFPLQPLPPNQRKKASHKTLLHQPVKNTTTKMDLIRFLHKKEPEKQKVMLFCNYIRHDAAAAWVYFVYHIKEDQFSKSPYVSRGNTKLTRTGWQRIPESQNHKLKISNTKFLAISQRWGSLQTAIERNQNSSKLLIAAHYYFECIDGLRKY
jgi:hypothetical protein